MKEPFSSRVSFNVTFFVALIFLVLIFLCTLFFKVPKSMSYLTYSDLVELSRAKELNEKTKIKLDKQLSTPYILNNKSYVLKNLLNINKSLKLGNWNVERGYKVDDIKNIFSSLTLNQEAREFSMCDIITLNEVDIGMPRTQYKNVVKEIAEAGGYNYAFATEFIELSPIISMLKHDKGKFLALHGNAVLSKYPIKSANIINLPQCYNWYYSEIARKSPLETLRRYSAKGIFKEEILVSEVRRGNRNALVTEIELPGRKTITVISTHLEDRAFPECRLAQIQKLLHDIKNKSTPVVIAGDFNTTTTDSIPTSFKKEFLKRAKDPHFLARNAALLLIPGAPWFSGFAATGLAKLFQYNDPTAPSIPIVFPNKERALFSYIKFFRFADNEIFDFSGDPKRSFEGKAGLLSSSNERAIKGFKHTFKFEEPRLIAYFKLDWFFVKPKDGKYFPYNGRTLKYLNESIPGKISDHNPIIVDLKL